VVIPGGLYRGNDSPTPSFGLRATLLTAAATSDGVVYLVVKSVIENVEEFTGLHPALAHLDQREMPRAALTTPLHPVLSALPRSRADVNEGCDAARTRVGSGSRNEPASREWVRFAGGGVDRPNAVG
jgi:NMT1-like family